jgi:hypothetical protein
MPRDPQSPLILGELASRLARAVQVPRIEPLRVRLHTALDGVDPGRMLEAVRRAVQGLEGDLLSALPENWRDIDFDELERAVMLAMEDGLALVWVPRGEIVRAMIDAPSRGEREAILLARESEILDDVDGALNRVQGDRLVHPRDLARAAAAAHRDGHHAAAQTLAAAALSALVHGFGFQRFAQAREEWERDHPMEVDLFDVRITTLLQAFARALHHTDYARPGFNRHATQHGHVGQFTTQHALTAHLLLGGLLRELVEATGDGV